MTDRQKIVLEALRAYCVRERCAPTLRAMADELDMNHTGVRDHLVKLVDAGAVEQRADGHFWPVDYP